jgi:hypothetical protein
MKLRLKLDIKHSNEKLFWLKKRLKEEMNKEDETVVYKIEYLDLSKIMLKDCRINQFCEIIKICKGNFNF